MKKIYLHSDQVIYWNITKDGDRKEVFIEEWGRESLERFLNLLLNYFNIQDKHINWKYDSQTREILDLNTINPANAKYNHIIANWKPYPESNKTVWRINEIDIVGKKADTAVADLRIEDLVKADVILVQDWGMNVCNSAFPETFNEHFDGWLIYSPHHPVFKGNLWQSILPGLGKNDVIVLRADDLRKLGVSIGRGLSWEQTIQDIITEIYCEHNISLHPLEIAEYVIISFGYVGTLLLHNQRIDNVLHPEIVFFFDSMGLEGSWETKHAGNLPGSMELLLTLLTKEVIFPINGNKVDFSPAIRAHLLGSCALHLKGANVKKESLCLDCLHTEFDKVYGANPTTCFLPVTLDISQFKSINHARNDMKSMKSRDWSLLSKTKWDFYSLARQIAINGPLKPLDGLNIPIAKYNNLVTVDRKEIEYLNNLQSLFSEYLQLNNNQPLSIAVFGSPGSGKSYCIKQLSKSLGLPTYEIQPITFNLSQFSIDNPNDLYQAFHAVRDISLSGKIPLVFWDEFDSNDLAWLRFFLAPMEDGEFQEGQLTHNIGKSIFVFAGGTCSSMETFEQEARKAITKKGPDFLSRIKGYLNVMGPNPLTSNQNQQQSCSTPEDETTLFIEAKNADPEYIIRRAILLNSLLQDGYRNLFNEGKLQIDDGVLNALLLVPKYKHGNRSMQTIFKISRLYGKSKFNRSDLPPQSQMNLHVDGEHYYSLTSPKIRYLNGGEAFYHLVNEIEFDEKIITSIATGIHAMYTVIFKSGKADDPLSVTKEEFLTHFEEMGSLLDDGLLQDEISQNYHNARKIPEKLAAVGFQIKPLTTQKESDNLNEEEFEIVSRLEHIRWVRHHIDNGWCYAPTKNKALKQHDTLVAWDEDELHNLEEIYGKSYTLKMGVEDGVVLSEKYRDIDRAITKAIPWILETVGYKMVRG